MDRLEDIKTTIFIKISGSLRVPMSTFIQENFSKYRSQIYSIDDKITVILGREVHANIHANIHKTFYSK